MQNILIVEDEKKVLALIKEGLQHSGRAVEGAESPAAARILMKSKKFDLIILDVMLPGTSGTEFAKEIRSAGWNGFILMLTALSTTSDKIAGLDSGADDYLTKPFELEELLARIRALGRRKADSKSRLQNGSLIMDLISREVSRDGIRVELTTKEFSLLEFFMRHLDRVVDRNAIARQVWGTEFDPDSNVIDVYINHLRKKIDNPFPRKILKTVVGQGYVLQKTE
jgi:two-component system copper resistance phosphate regulon response regulator CusR